MARRRPITRDHPNIAISGTPGTGKSTLASALVKRIDYLRLLDLNKAAERYDCCDEYDEKLESWVIDEDKVQR